MAPTAFTKAGGGTIRWAPGLGWIWSVVAEVVSTPSGPSIGVTALAAAVTQEIDLNVAFPTLVFPENVQLGQAYLKRQVDLAGGAITAVTAEVGDTGDPNGLITALDVFTGAAATATYSDTIAAAEFGMHVEEAFIPTLSLVSTTANLDQLDVGGKFTICIPIRPLHD